MSKTNENTLNVSKTSQSIKNSFTNLFKAEKVLQKSYQSNVKALEKLTTMLKKKI